MRQITEDELAVRAPSRRTMRPARPKRSVRGTQHRLARVFDPADHDDPGLALHAIDIMLGCL